MRFIKLIIVFLIVSSVGFAQNISMEETISFINRKMEGRYKLTIDRRQLNIEVLNDDKELIREDLVMIDELDWETIKYYPDEGSLVIRCENKGYDCFERNLIVKGLKDYVHRFNFIVKDDKEAEALRKALVHMIRLVREKKYESAEPFE